MKRFARDLAKHQDLFSSYVSKDIVIDSGILKLSALLKPTLSSAVEDGAFDADSFESGDVDKVIEAVKQAVTPVTEEDIAALARTTGNDDHPAAPVPVIFPFNGRLYTLDINTVIFLLGLTLDSSLTDAQLISTVRETWMAPSKRALPCVFKPLEVNEKSSFNSDSVNTMMIVPPVECSWPRIPLATLSDKRLLSGATVVLGGPNAGKTTFVTKIANADVIIRVGERGEMVDYDPRVISVRSILDAIGLAWWFAMIGARVVVDSLRALAYGMKGAAASRGLKAELFNQLTDIANLFNVARSNVVLTLNPLSDDGTDDEENKKLLRLMFANIASSASSALWLENRGTVVSAALITADDRVDAQSPGTLSLNAARRGSTAMSASQYRIGTTSDMDVEINRGATTLSVNTLDGQRGDKSSYISGGDTSLESSPTSPSRTGSAIEIDFE